MAMTMQKPMAFPSTHPGTFGEAPGMSARDMREKYAGKPAFNDPTIGQVVMFDGKRMRKAVHRKTIDYNTSIVNYLEDRIWQRDFRDRRALQPDPLYQIEMTPPMHMYDNSINCVTTKFIRTSTNKFRCPIFCLAWTPEGRRLVTGASSGEFTLWNGLTFNFETILQAHDTSCRAMQWSHNDSWMVTADHSGYIKYWQSNMNNVKMYQGHKEPIRGISFCPTDSKFATCSDDGTVRIWDFMKCIEEKILRGHGADVKCVDWHPQKSLVASGSKDNQQPLKLWDAKTGTSLATIHAHKGTVMSLKWNKNGNWLLTASRDHLMKLFDIRNMKEELQTFKGHKKEATAVAWHPIHESLIVSGGSDGAVLFWNVGTDKEVGGMEEAHEGMVWSIAWHPMGHILATGSNDHTTKFWTRNRPGDRMRDKYNLNTLPGGSEHELPEYEVENQNTNQSILSIPGMGLPLEKEQPAAEIEDEAPVIPGLDWSNDSQYMKETHYIPKKKIPYAKPIPWEFEQAWADKHSVPISKDSDAEKKKQENKTKGIPSLLDTPIMLKPGILPQNVPNDGNPGQGPAGNIVSPASTNRPEMPGSGPPNPNINMMRGVNVNETRPNTPVIRPSGGSGILGPGPANLIFRGQLMGPGGPGFRPNGQAMRPPGPNLGPGGQNIRPGGPFMGQGLIRMNVGGPNIRPGGPRVPLERGDNWNEQMVGGPLGSFGDRPQNGTWQNEAEEESWKSDKGPESGGYQDYEMTENWEEGEGNYSTYSEGEKPAEYHGEDGYGNQRPQNREPRAHMREDRGRPPDGFHQKRGGYFGRERSEDRHQGQQMYPEDESMETDDSFHQASHPGRDMDTYPESEHYANREDSYYGRDTRQGGMESHRGSFREGDQWSTSPRARGRGFRGVGERGRGVDRGRGIMNRGQGGMERGRGGMERGRGMDRGRGMERGRGGMERGWRGDRGRIGGRGPRGMRGRYNGT